jgi:hypothetical protein
MFGFNNETSCSSALVLLYFSLVCRDVVAMEVVDGLSCSRGYYVRLTLLRRSDLYTLFVGKTRSLESPKSSHRMYTSTEILNLVDERSFHILVVLDMIYLIMKPDT